MIARAATARDGIASLHERCASEERQTPYSNDYSSPPFSLCGGGSPITAPFLLSSPIGHGDHAGVITESGGPLPL